MGYPELYTNLFLPFSDAVFWAKIILDVPKRGEGGGGGGGKLSYAHDVITCSQRASSAFLHPRSKIAVCCQMGKSE